MDNLNKDWFKIFQKKIEYFKDIFNTYSPNLVKKYYIEKNSLYYNVIYTFNQDFSYYYKKKFENFVGNYLIKEYKKADCDFTKYYTGINWSFDYNNYSTKPSNIFVVHIEMNNWHALAINDPIVLLIPKLGHHNK